MIKVYATRAKAKRATKNKRGAYTIHRVYILKKFKAKWK